MNNYTRDQKAREESFLKHGPVALAVKARNSQRAVKPWRKVLSCAMTPRHRYRRKSEHRSNGQVLRVPQSSASSTSLSA